MAHPKQHGEVQRGAHDGDNTRAKRKPARVQTLDSCAVWRRSRSTWVVALGLNGAVTFFFRAHREDRRRAAEGTFWPRSAPAGLASPCSCACYHHGRKTWDQAQCGRYSLLRSRRLVWRLAHKFPWVRPCSRRGRPSVPLFTDPKRTNCARRLRSARRSAAREKPNLPPKAGLRNGGVMGDEVEHLSCTETRAPAIG